MKQQSREKNGPGLKHLITKFLNLMSRIKKMMWIYLRRDQLIDQIHCKLIWKNLNSLKIIQSILLFTIVIIESMRSL